MSDGDKKRTCSPCLRGAHQLCTTPATCAHAHDKCAVKVTATAPTERKPVTERRGSGTSDRQLIERAYSALWFLRSYAHPNLWTAEMTALVLDMEDALSKPRSGTIREPRSEP